ncbi:MAG: hypothetical protein EOO90_06425 [Pedobacter sp.]|nr:MAG: hypothetical protein EOO90_06425 [Pedobacter sp.]
MKSDHSLIPTLLYHGTDANFDTFDVSYKGTNTGYENKIHGFFFTEKLVHAQLFGKRIIAPSLAISNPIDLTIPGIFTIASQAPLIWGIISGEILLPAQALETLDNNIGLGEINDLFAELNTEKASEMIRSAGYDAIISDMGDHNMEYVVFDPSQIKIFSSLTYL